MDPEIINCQNSRPSCCSVAGVEGVTETSGWKSGVRYFGEASVAIVMQWKMREFKLIKGGRVEDWCLDLAFGFNRDELSPCTELFLE